MAGVDNGCDVAEHDKRRQRFDQLVEERRHRLGREPSREDVREILNQLDRERSAELGAMIANADAPLDNDDLTILDAMDDEPSHEQS